MSIFEYDKELEEKKLRKAEYEAGFSEGEKHGHEAGLSLIHILLRCCSRCLSNGKTFL